MNRTLTFFLLLVVCTVNAGRAEPFPEPCAAREDAKGIEKDMAAAPQKPTLITVMSARYVGLRHALAGLKQSHWPLILDDPKLRMGDDPGQLIVIPMVALLLSTSIEHAIDITYILLLVVATTSGILGLFRLSRSWRFRVIAIAWLAVPLGLAGRSGDVYIAATAIAVALVPWILVLRRKCFAVRGLNAVMALVGALIGCAHVFRSHSGTATALFLLILMWCSRDIPKRTGMIATAALVAGFALPVIAVQQTIRHRDEILQVSGSTQAEAAGHVFWHSVYTGFGYLSNPDIPRYLDAVAIDKVCSVDPTTTFVSRRYEQILRSATITFVRTHPKFVVYTLAAKAGVLAVLLLLTATPFAFFGGRRDEIVVHLAFWAAILFSCLPGLLATPQPCYLWGALTFCVLYGIWRRTPSPVAETVRTTIRLRATAPEPLKAENILS